MKRMLFNATQAEELRVAIVDGQKLIDLDIESATKEQKKSNIYKAVITRIEPSLEAAFVDYGSERHGFLPFKEISRVYFQPGVDAGRATIREALREGQELIVQVDKDERGNKGAAMTTFISLAGRHLVLMPNNPRGGGVSRRVEGDERAELRDIMDQLAVPAGMSLIARTAAIGRSSEELQWDLNYLLQLWKAIEGAANQQSGAFLIYQEGSLVIRAIRDYFQPDIGEILIDTDDVFEQARQFMSHVMPATANRIKRYRDDVPLFSRFQIEHQIESAYSRQVTLPSGGAIVIDHTEALVSVDVNSGRSTRGADIEETAFKTNLEAAEEVARQLRLRDLGGLIVVDFIDMESARNQREVENRLRDSLRVDRARVQTGKISRFGLMELSRQRLRPALAETSYIPCPRCSGTGHIRSAESAALHILRILEEEAMKDNTAAVHTQVPVDVATFLLNEKRHDIHAIELRHKVSILLIPNIHLETPQHSIQRLRHDELNQEELQQPSYRMVEDPAEENGKQVLATQEPRVPRQEAAIKGITPQQPAPIVPERTRENKDNGESGGLLAKILAWFRGTPAEEPAKPAAKQRPNNRRDAQREGRDNRRNGRNNRRDEERETKQSREAREMRETRPPAQRESAEKNDKSNEKSREAKDAREARRQRGEQRQERKERPATPLAENDAANLAGASGGNEASEAMTEENGNSRRRGRRGGRRDRREVAPNPSAETSAEISHAVAPSDAQSLVLTQTSSEISVTAQAVVSETQALVDTVVSASTIVVSAEIPAPAVNERLLPVTTADDVVIGESAAMQTAAETEWMTAATLGIAPCQPAVTLRPSTVETAPEAEETSAPAFAETAAADIIPAPAEKAIDISQALASSGLVMVETSHEKIQEWHPEAPSAETTPRARRRRPPVEISSEPLVMVETRPPV